MVYDDISPLKKPNHQVHKVTPYFRASILDRLFSFLLDYLVLSPVISFLILIFFQKEISIWSANTFSPELKSVFMLLAVVYVVLFSFLQSLFIYFWQATPGQFFLKLKIIDENEQSGLRLFRITIRQLGFWFSFLFLGFPLISILSHTEQKTFYDKLSEMKVVSLKSKPDFFSFEFESRYWQALMSTFLIFFAFILAAVGWQQHQNIKSAAYTFDKMQNENYFCDELKSVQFSERLQMVIALNLVGQIADKCVDKEADFVLWKSDNLELKSLAYYAKSLTEKETQFEEKYLESACQTGAEKFLGCKLASAFMNHELLELYQVLKKSKQTETLLTSVLRYEFGQSLEQMEDQKANFQKIKEFDTHVLVKKYLLTEILNNTPTLVKNTRSIASEGDGEEASAISDKDFEYSKKLIHDM